MKQNNLAQIRHIVLLLAYIVIKPKAALKNDQRLSHDLLFSLFLADISR